MWKKTTLGKVCKMYQPKTIPKKEMKENGKYFVYGANGIIGKYDKYNHKEPQLLITCRGATCGAINISKPYSWINGNAMVIQPDIKEISLKFIEYLFKGNINLSKIITGSAQPQITRESLNTVVFSYPSLPEQQHIVAKLDAAFVGINKLLLTTKNKQEHFKLVKSKILNNKLFSISKKTGVPKKSKLGDISNIVRGGSPRPIKKYLTNDEKGVNWIKISDATRSIKYIKNTAQKIKPDGVSRSRLVKEGDFILSNSMSFGRPYILQITGCIHDGWLAISNYQKEFDMDYLYLLLSSSTLFHQFNLAARGSTVRNLNIQKVKNILVTYPSIDVQKKIVNEINKIFEQFTSLEKTQYQKIKQLEKLKFSILSQTLLEEKNKRVV